MIFKDQIKQQNGVFIATEPDHQFADIYIKVRNKERRIYSNEELLSLPNIINYNPHFDEWKLRQKSAKRFVAYLINKRPDSQVLEIGCGNGWFTNICATHSNFSIGIDVNLPELEQAAQVFKEGNLAFAYWNVFSENPFASTFNIIVVNAVIQYFPDTNELIKKLQQYLSPGGEIHIIDSPFYNLQDIENAKKRSRTYYKSLGVPVMADHYFHHNKTVISDFEVLYKPTNNKLKRLIKGKDMPFGWYRKIYK